MSILKGQDNPINLKKVSMRVWSLKEHLIAILNARLENAGGDIEKIKDITDLKEEFNFGDQWPETKEKGEELKEEKNEEGEKITLYRRKLDIPEENMAHGMAILYEINFNKIHFFCDENFFIGSSIVFSLDVPKAFEIAAVVLDCRPFDLESKIISEIKYSYRIVAEFKFLKKGQLSMLREFLTAINPEKPQAEEVEIPTEASKELPPEIEKQKESA